ncbi:hypothetical protein ACGF8D_10545 [Streptomyces massasporeus]|uniref:hypothetical protein n=1 Tax=Streptomyces massasporeus TaxID=67324 RepID=UPI00371AA2EE
MLQYESDESAVQRMLADESVTLIDHGTARTIAAWFNGPGAVAGFVSTGIIKGDTAFPTDEIMHLIRSGVDAVTLRANEAALDALEAYLQERENYFDLEPVDGWTSMWVPKHVDRPHESGALDTCWCYDESEGED